MGGLPRLLAVAVALLMVAAPAVSVAAPHGGLESGVAHASPEAEAAFAGSGGSGFMALQDETLLVPLFNKSGKYYLVLPVFRVENGTIVTYVASMLHYVGLKVFTLDGEEVFSGYAARALDLIPLSPYKVLSPAYRSFNSYMFDANSWSTTSVSVSYVKGVLAGNGSVSLFSTDAFTARVFEVSDDGAIQVFKGSHGLALYDPSDYTWHPFYKNGNEFVGILSDAMSLGTSDSTRIFVYRGNLSSQTGSIAEFDVGNSTEAYYATIYRGTWLESYARILYPWFFGLSPVSGNLYVIDLQAGELSTYNVWELLGTELESPYLTTTTVSGEPRIVIAGIDPSTTPGVPFVAIIDPASMSVVDTLRLEGFPSPDLAVEHASYGSTEALYLLVQGYILIVDIETLSLIGAEPSGIASPISIDYGENNGVAMLVALGYNETGSPRAEFYSIGGTATPAGASMTAPETVYTGEPFTVNITLQTLTGQPLAGKTVVVEMLTSEGWTPIATGLTDSEGKASLTVTLFERGEHLLRAHYPGGDGYTAAYSRPAKITALDKAHVTVTLQPDTTVEGVPASAVVYVEKPSGAPLEGVWVALHANISSTWAIVGAGMTGANGVAVIPLNLPTGTYKIIPSIATPYVEMAWNNSATLRVVPPLPPPPDGPYTAPVGRVLAFAPPMAEKGQEAAVVFAFYYGEAVLEPDNVEVTITPGEPYTIEQVQPGVYRVVFTPGQTGVYTVVLTATFNGAAYVGAASFYVYNIMERVASWEAQLSELVARLLELNETITWYLENISSTLNRLNLTEIQGMIERISENTSIILLKLDSVNKSLENATIEIIREVTGTITENISDARGQLETLIIGNWQEIQALNTTIHQLAENLNTSIESVRVLVASNGQLLAAINTSIASLAEALERANATIIGEIRIVEGAILYAINTSTGTLLASASTLQGLLEETGYKLELINATTLRIESTLGTVNTSIATALGELYIIKGQLESLQATGDGIIAEIRTANGTLASILLDRLQPRIESIAGDLALLNTSVGYIIANLTLAQQAIATLQGTLDTVNSKLDTIQQALDQVNTKLEQAPTQDELRQVDEKAGQARTIALAGVGTGIAGLGAALALARRP